MSDLILDWKPVLKEGKPMMVYFFKDARGNYLRDVTPEELAQINGAVQKRILEFWAMPKGQLCEWGK